MSSNHPPLPQVGAPPSSSQLQNASVAATAAREPHLLSLKVLRAARPSLAPAMPHLFYERDTFSGDLIHDLNTRNSVPSASEVQGAHAGALMLPSTFGTIYLGETFSALLSLSNDLPLPLPNPTSPSPSSSTPSPIAISPTLKVEVHTNPPPNAPPGTKHTLKTVTLPQPEGANVPSGLGPGTSLESIVSHEIKELVPHSLVCTVTYGVVVRAEDGIEETKTRSFRKVYKFQVSNPLSVRTKAHSPSPYTASASLSATERSKVFLEVQVQNQGEHSMTFERMRFDPVPGWSVHDPNEGLFRGSEALLGPAAVRQYLYILTMGDQVPKAEPGSSQGLGRLDIIWRTPNGELGRLQTSMLGRRVPQALPGPAQAASSARPPPGQQLAASPLRGPAPPAMAQQALNSNPSTPVKPGNGGPAPYRRSPRVDSSPEPPTSPSSSVPSFVAAPPLAPLIPDVTGLSFDLTAKVLAGNYIPHQTPFEVELELAVAYAPAPSADGSNQRRRLKLAFQHVHHAPVSSSSPAMSSRQAPSAILSVPGAVPSASGPVSTTPLPGVPSNARASLDTPSSTPTPATGTLPPAIAPTRSSYRGIVLPPPSLTSTTGLGGPYRPSPTIQLLGSSLVVLPDLILSAPKSIGPEGPNVELGTAGPSALLPPGIVKARMKFVSMGNASGLMRVGGLRVLLLENDEDEGDERTSIGSDLNRERRARIVNEWDVVAEIWAAST